MAGNKRKRKIYLIVDLLDTSIINCSPSKIRKIDSPYLSFINFTNTPSRTNNNDKDTNQHEREELVTCNCCFDEVKFEDCGACNEGDLFCKSCIKKSAEVRIGDGETTFPCLQACGAQFSLQLLQSVLQASVFFKVQRRIQIEEVIAADIEGLEFCPFCEFAAIPPPETSVFSCLSPECLKESCRKCHKVSHIPQRCEELESDDQTRARKYIEDEMTKALVRECYKCKKSFIKVEGCNMMTCTCGARMCYVCRQPVMDHKHFNRVGGSEVDKCPLFSTDKLLHVDAVKVVAEKALKRVRETNPFLQLKHDPTKMLPTTREKTLGERFFIQRRNPSPTRLLQTPPRHSVFGNQGFAYPHTLPHGSPLLRCYNAPNGIQRNNVAGSISSIFKPASPNPCIFEQNLAGLNARPVSSTFKAASPNFSIFPNLAGPNVPNHTTQTTPNFPHLQNHPVVVHNNLLSINQPFQFKDDLVEQLLRLKI